AASKPSASAWPTANAPTSSASTMSSNVVSNVSKNCLADFGVSSCIASVLNCSNTVANSPLPVRLVTNPSMNVASGSSSWEAAGDILIANDEVVDADTPDLSFWVAHMPFTA